MRTRSILMLSLAGLAAAACRPGDAQHAAATATVTLRDRDGAQVGELRLEETPAGVLVSGTVSGLSAGTRAIHFHAVGRCEAPFETAGGHFNPAAREHGFRNPRGHHAGDLPNFTIPVGAPATFDILAAGLTLGGSGGLLDDDGTAVVIHASADDYRTDPAGDAGDRIACGVVTR